MGRRGPSRGVDRLHGVLVVDKPAGPTSAAVVALVRRALGAASVGHTGTLDPMATGVLPLVLGEATKLAGHLLADDKEYEGELELGFQTDTLDLEGQVLHRAPVEAVREVTRAAVEAGLVTLTGELLQRPPLFSALHHEGRRLHEIARAGETVTPALRPVRVDRFTLLSFDSPRARFVVACGKGTYVRSLVRDLGERLGVGATLVALRRTRAGRFSLADAISLDEVALLAQARLVTPSDAVGQLPQVLLTAADLVHVQHGRQLFAPPGLTPGAAVRLVTEQGTLAALAEERAGRLAYLRVMTYAEPTP